MNANAALYDALTRMGLLAEGKHPPLTALEGGVSSDIVKLDLEIGPACVKRALPQLKVEADWRAPVQRNHYEVAWMRHAAEVVPDAVPALLGADEQASLFAMRYLEPSLYPVWKSELRDGVIEASTAAEVADRIGRIHGATAGRRDVARTFSTDDIFTAIRIEPYLLATADAHPDCRARLEHLAASLARSKHALVHGDLSPKNILVGPNGPVLLDAECAWYGDPAFDVAFCLNHLLLKCVWRPHWGCAYLESFHAFIETYRAGIGWEDGDALAARVAALLPALLLARIDGKSPVEYISDERDRERVRGIAKPLLQDPPPSPEAVAERWASEFAR